MRLSQPSFVRCGLLVVAMLGGVIGAWAQVAPPGPAAEPSHPRRTGDPVILEDFTVVTTEEDYDATGMGSVEAEMSDAPFANDLISVADYVMEGDNAEMNSELAAVAETSPADRIAGGDRLNLRGLLARRPAAVAADDHQGRPRRPDPGALAAGSVTFLYEW